MGQRARESRTSRDDTRVCDEARGRMSPFLSGVGCPRTVRLLSGSLGRELDTMAMDCCIPIPIPIPLSLPPPCTASSAASQTSTHEDARDRRCPANPPSFPSPLFFFFFLFLTSFSPPVQSVRETRISSSFCVRGR